MIDVTPLREQRSFRLLWFGQLVSVSGTQLRLVAVPYQIFLLTGSSLDVGLLGLFQAVPFIAFALFGGAIADRFDRRRLLLVTQVCLAGCSAALAIGTQAGAASISFLYAITAIGAAFSAVDGPARGSLTPNLVPRSQLASAISLNQIIFQFGAVAGPILAGFIIQGFGIAAAYWIDVATFAVAFLAVAALVVPKAEARIHPPILRAVGEGIAYLRANRTLLATFVLDFLATFFGSPRALFPYYAEKVFAVGPQGLGLLFAAPGLGSLVAALASGWIPRVRRHGLAVLAAVATWGLAIAGFGFMQAGLFLPALALVAFAEGADTVSAILRHTILQTLVPDELRGRLLSIAQIFFLGGPYLGQVESGVVAEAISPEIAVISGGLLTIASVGLVGVWAPELVSYRAPARDTIERASRDA